MLRHGTLDPISKRLLICGVPRPGRSGSQLAIEFGYDGPVVCVHVIHSAVVVRHDLLVVLINLPVIRVCTPLVVPVHPADLALQLALSPALHGTHLAIELGCVEGSCHQMLRNLIDSDSGTHTYIDVILPPRASGA
jgi:hypothetical protein